MKVEKLEVPMRRFPSMWETFIYIYIAIILTAGMFGALAGLPSIGFLITAAFGMGTGSVLGLYVAPPTTIAWLFIRKAFGEHLHVCVIFGATVGIIIEYLLNYYEETNFSPIMLSVLGIITGVIYWSLSRYSQKKYEEQFKTLGTRIIR